MKIKPDKQILELTNKFIEDFFILSEQLDDNAKKERARNESYYFHYGLADAIGFSDYAVNKRTRHRDYPLLTEGSVLPGDNICRLLFDLSIEGAFGDLTFALNNIEHQLEDDCRIEVIKVGDTATSFFCVTQNVKLYCTFSNSNTLELRLKKGSEVFHKVVLATTFNAKDMVFEPQKEHTEILYWSHHREISEFYSCLSVVLSEIKDELEDE